MDLPAVPVLSVLLVLLLDIATGQQKGAEKGYYEKWAKWSMCSQSCGSGLITRTRVWVQPPHEQPFDEPFTMTEHRGCSSGRCPVDGSWSPWARWAPCSEACGGGTRQRTRSCIPPRFQGEPCKGETFEEDECNRVPCPPLPARFNPSACTQKHFMCSSRKMCVPITELCDDTVQCHDGSDETRCYEVDGMGSVKYLITDSGSSFGASTVVILSMVAMVTMT